MGFGSVCARTKFTKGKKKNGMTWSADRQRRRWCTMPEWRNRGISRPWCKSSPWKVSLGGYRCRQKSPDCKSWRRRIAADRKCRYLRRRSIELCAMAINRILSFNNKTKNKTKNRYITERGDHVAPNRRRLENHEEDAEEAGDGGLGQLLSGQLCVTIAHLKIRKKRWTWGESRSECNI